MVANSIQTPQTPKSSAAFCTTANTTYSATPGNTVLLVQAGASGSRLTKLRAIPTATVTVTQLQEFRDFGTAGVTKNFSNSVLGASGGYTMAQTTAPPIADFGYSDDNPKILQANERLYVAVGVTGTWSFEAEWADY